MGDRLAKAMPPLVMGRDTPLKYCLELNDKYADGYRASQEIRDLYESDDEVRHVIDVAKGLEGLKRSVGIHAAAVVISKNPLTDYLPLQRRPPKLRDVHLEKNQRMGLVRPTRQVS